MVKFKILNLVGVGFLVLTLVTGVTVVANPQIKELISPKASDSNYQLCLKNGGKPSECKGLTTTTTTQTQTQQKKEEPPPPAAPPPAPANNSTPTVGGSDLKDIHLKDQEVGKIGYQYPGTTDIAGFYYSQTTGKYYPIAGGPTAKDLSDLAQKINEQKQKENTTTTVPPPTIQQTNLKNTAFVTPTNSPYTSPETKTYTSLEKTDEGFIQNTTTITRNGNTGQIITADTKQAPYVAPPTASISIGAQGSASIKIGAGGACQYNSDCSTGLFCQSKTCTKSKDYPVGIYYSVGPKVSGADQVSQQTFQYLKDKGVNSIILQQKVDNPNTVLNAANNAGINLVLNPNSFKQNGDINTSLLSQAAESPSLVGFYGYDEPAPDSKITTLYPTPDNPLYSILHKYAPNIPVTTVYDSGYGFPLDSYGADNNANFANKFNTLTNTQVMGTDPYFWNKNVSNTQINQNISQLNSFIKSGVYGPTVKTPIAILSGHSDAFVPRLQQSYNYQAVSAVVGGAQAIYYWDWPPGCTPQNCPNAPTNSNLIGYQQSLENISTVAKTFQAVEPGLTGQTYNVGQNNDVTYRLTQSPTKQAYAFVISNSGDLTPSANKYVSSPIDSQSILQTIQANTTKQTQIYNLPPNSTFNVVNSNQNLNTNYNGVLNIDTYTMANYILQQTQQNGTQKMNINFPSTSMYCIFNPAYPGCYYY